MITRNKHEKKILLYSKKNTSERPDGPGTENSSLLLPGLAKQANACAASISKSTSSFPR